jgi:hypothetical protein
MPYQPSIGANDAFTSGVAHIVNPGRANANSVTLNDSASTADQGLADTSARWDASTPHAVLRTALGGSPSGTDAGIEFGQQALGNTDDQAQARDSMNRMLMMRGADIGQDDGIA